jgi:hypothetical protein
MRTLLLVAEACGMALFWCLVLLVALVVFPLAALADWLRNRRRIAL